MTVTLPTPTARDRPHQFGVPFHFANESSKFGSAMLRAVQKQLNIRITQVIAPNNISRYGHGQKWVTRFSDTPDDIGTFREHSSLIEIRGEDIVAGNLAMLPRAIANMCTQMFDNMMSSLYEVAYEATKHTGNIVNATTLSLPEAFKQSLEKITFGVDHEGNVSVPQFHVPPGFLERLQKEVEVQGPAFAKEIEEITARKSREALEEEAARRQRYKGCREAQ